MSYVHAICVEKQGVYSEYALLYQLKGIVCVLELSYRKGIFFAREKLCESVKTGLLKNLRNFYLCV